MYELHAGARANQDQSSFKPVKQSTASFGKQECVGGIAEHDQGSSNKFYRSLRSTTLSVRDASAQLLYESNLVEDAGPSIACVGTRECVITINCTEINKISIRWVMEPFINSSSPVTFDFEDNIGKCKPDIKFYPQLEFCLTHYSPNPDESSRANMTSTLTFKAAEKINGIPLNGTTVMCNEKSTTLRVIKGIMVM